MIVGGDLSINMKIMMMNKSLDMGVYLCVCVCLSLSTLYNATLEMSGEGGVFI